MAAVSEAATESETTEGTTTETVDASAALKFAAAYNTLLEDSIKFRKFDKFLEKIKKIKYPEENEENEEETEEPKLKIVVVGDSISAGGNNHPRNTWFERFVKKLKDNIEVDAEYINMCIHGRSIYEFADTSYVLSEQWYANNYSWIEEGAKWMDLVLAQNPDVVIIAFGANYWGNAGVNYKDEVAWNNVAAKLADECDIVVVTPFLSLTQGKYEYYDDNGKFIQGEIKNSYINASAEVQRSFAKEKKWNMIDVNNISNLLTYKKMILNETPVRVNSFAEFRGAKAFKNCEIDCVINLDELKALELQAGMDAAALAEEEAEKEQGFSVRTERGEDIGIVGFSNRTLIRFAFCIMYNQPYVRVKIDVAGDKWVQNIRLTGNKINIKVLDDLISVSGDVEPLVATINLNDVRNNMFTGGVEVSYEGAEEPTDASLDDSVDCIFTSFAGTIHYPTEIGAGMSDEELLGSTIGNAGYEGNGINHPTALGEYFNYGTITQMYADKMIDLYRMATI